MIKQSNFEKLKFSLISLLLIVLLLAFSGQALAELQINTYQTSTDFSVQVPSTINVCSCAFYDDYFTLTNSGTYTTSYVVESSNPELFSLPSKEITLSPDQSANINYHINADCDFKNEMVKLTIKSNLGKYQEHLVNINGGLCQNLAATLEYDKENIMPAEPVMFNLSVFNTGNFKETYYFDLGKYSEYATSEYGSVKLLPNQEANFEIYLNLPADITGNVSVPLNVYSLNTELKVPFTSKIFVENKYDFDADIAKSLFSCSEENNLFSFTLNNNDNFKNKFTVFSNNKLIQILNRSVEVPSNTSEKIEFFVKKTDEIQNQNISFDIVSDLGNIKKTINTSLDIGKCYDLKILLDKYNYDFVGTEQKDIKFKIKNTAAKGQNVALYLPHWTATFDLSNKSFYLNSGETKEITLRTDKIPDLSKVYELPIQAIVNGRIFENEISIDIQPSHNAYKVIIDPKVQKINYDADNATLKFIHVGSRKAKYNIEITELGNKSESDWIFMDAEFNKTFDYINPSYDLTVDFAGNLWNNPAKDYVFNVNIKPLNINNENLEYNYKYTVKLRDKSVFYYSWIWITNNLSLVALILFLLLLLLFLLYLFFSKPKNAKQKEKRKKTSKKIVYGYFLLILLWLILLLFLCPIKSIYPSVSEDNSNFNLNMYSDEIQNIDLDKFFVDPDNDILEYYYKVNAINNSDSSLDVNFDGDIVLISVSNKSAEGTYSVWFYASDSKYVTKSDAFIINVEKRPDFGFMDYVNFYLCYIIWLFVSLLLLIYVIGFVSWGKRKVKNKKKSKSRNKKVKQSKKTKNKTNKKHKK